MNKIIQGDCLEVMKTLDPDSVDVVITDPPYGYSFMGKDWDKAVPLVDTWKECLRVLKPGSFACVMSAPRSDVQMHMIQNLTEAGFRLDFTPIYWTYASGFPKAGNIGKLVDKRRIDDVRPVCRFLREQIDASKYSVRTIATHFDFHPRMVEHWAARDTDSQPTVPKWEQWLQLKELLEFSDEFDVEVWRLNGRKGNPDEAWDDREVLGEYESDAGGLGGVRMNGRDNLKRGGAVKPEAKALDGSYAGFQPKPAVEVIIVAMKPLSEKTFVDQALKNGKGISWLDNCRIPAGEDHQQNATRSGGIRDGFLASELNATANAKGRFPANLLVSDDVLNDGVVRKPGKRGQQKADVRGQTWGFDASIPVEYADSGSYSRYFDLDKWASTLPFLIVPKASKGEKNKGLNDLPDRLQKRVNAGGLENEERWGPKLSKNHHPTVKPLKLMSYLVTLFSREGDTVLDPFLGSGTTVLAAKKLSRKYIGIELSQEYVEIAQARLDEKQEALF